MARPEDFLKVWLSYWLYMLNSPFFFTRGNHPWTTTRRVEHLLEDKGPSKPEFGSCGGLEDKKFLRSKRIIRRRQQKGNSWHILKQCHQSRCAGLLLSRLYPWYHWSPGKSKVMFKPYITCHSEESSFPKSLNECCVASGSLDGKVTMTERKEENSHFFRPQESQNTSS